MNAVALEPKQQPPPTPEELRRAEAGAKAKTQRGLRLSRDLVLFCVGVVGIVHEVFFTTIERPSLLILFAALCGLPLYLRRNGL